MARLVGTAPVSQPIAHHDVFLSLRFCEAKQYAGALQDALKARGISAFVCDVQPGGDISWAVIETLNACTLPVIMATCTYGQKTECTFSTYEELRFIVNEQKDFFLIKMCQRLKAAVARFHLCSAVAFHEWIPEQRGAIVVPEDLVDAIIAKLEAVKARGEPSANSNCSVPKLETPHGTKTRARAVLVDGQYRMSQQLHDILIEAFINPGELVRLCAHGYAVVEDFEGVDEEKLVEQGLRSMAARRLLKMLGQSSPQPQRDVSAPARALDAQRLLDNSTCHQTAKEAIQALVDGAPIEADDGEIDLAMCRLDDPAMMALTCALKQHAPSITSLRLSDNEVRGEGCEALARVIPSLGQLTGLGFGANKLEDNGCEALARVLNSSTLQSLRLYQNGITDTGCTALAHTLSSNTTVTHLALNENCISDTGCIALATALKHNTTLVKLSLPHNRISCKGCTALADALDSNTTLKELGLSNNDIGDEGITALSRSLMHNTSLTNLWLHANPISDNGAKAIVHLMANNITLQMLNLDKIRLSTAIRDHIRSTKRASLSVVLEKSTSASCS